MELLSDFVCVRDGAFCDVGIDIIHVLKGSDGCDAILFFAIILGGSLLDSSRI